MRIPRPKGFLPGRGAARVDLFELVLCFRQLETMLNAGVSLAACLDILCSAQWSPWFQYVLADLRDGVLSGARPSQVLTRHPEVFSREVVGILRVGEATGRLHHSMQSLATGLEKLHRQQQKLRSVMVYPLGILLVSLCMVAFVATVLLPQMSALMQSLELKLPPWMGFLLASLGVLCNPWLLVWLLELLLLSGFLLHQWVKRTQEGDEWRDSCLLALPVLAPIYRTVMLTRFCSVLGQTLGCGCSLMQGLQLSQQALDSPSFRAGLEQSMQRILEGDTCSEAFRDSGLFPSLFLHLVAVGEESSSLEPCLIKLHAIFESDLEDRLTTATSLIEPLVMIGLGSVVGILVVVCFLPMTQMVNQL